MAAAMSVSGFAMAAMPGSGQLYRQVLTGSSHTNNHYGKLHRILSFLFLTLINIFRD